MAAFESPDKLQIAAQVHTAVKALQKKMFSGEFDEKPPPIDNDDEAEKPAKKKKKSAKSQPTAPKKQLFPEQSRSVFLTIALKKAPLGCPQQFTRIMLPHPLHDARTVSVCLFVRDMTKKRFQADVDAQARDYKRRLNVEYGVTDEVTKIMSAHQVQREYCTHESKRQLASAYDVFLCDQRVSKLVGAHLGQNFLRQKKQPHAVDIVNGDVKSRLANAYKHTLLVVRETSSSCCVKIGRLSQAAKEVAENFKAVFECLQERLPGQLENIRSLHVGSDLGTRLPVYLSLGSSNMVDLPSVERKSATVEGELTTIEDAVGQSARVDAAGDVTVLDAEGKEVKVDIDVDGDPERAKRRRRKLSRLEYMDLKNPLNKRPRFPRKRSTEAF